MNGLRVITIRVILSALIAIVAITAASIMSWRGVEVPLALWFLATISVGGVAGAEVISSLRDMCKKGSPDDNRT